MGTLSAQQRSWPSAKNLIAGEYLTRMARDRGLNWFGTTSGPEPDCGNSGKCRAGLQARGIDVQDCKPVLMSADALARANYIISFGYDLDLWRPIDVLRIGAIKRQFETAWTFITGRIDYWTRPKRPLRNRGSLERRKDSQ